MDNLEKKENSAFDFSIKELIIYSILCLLLAFAIPFMNMTKNEETEACTTDIVSYSSDTITDLTGTSWKFNDVLTTDRFGDYSYNINYHYDNTQTSSYSFLYIKALTTYNGDLYLRFASNLTVYQRKSQGWVDEKYKTITIRSGIDVTNEYLIAFLKANATLQTPEIPSYTINANLTNVDTDSIFPMTVTSDSEIELSFVPKNGYIFNINDAWSFVGGGDLHIVPYFEENFNIHLSIRNITADLTISVIAHEYENLKGQWVLKDYSEIDLSSGIVRLEGVEFISNGKVFNLISNLNDNFALYYYNNLSDSEVAVLSSVGSISYIPTNTYNYNLIEITNDYYGYNGASGTLIDTTQFYMLFSRATTEDIAQINYKNGQLSILENEYTFIHLFGAIVDAPITALKGLLNFNFFGINLFSFLTLFVTLAIVFLCITMLKGGKKNE